MLRVESVSKDYKEFKLRDISFDVKKEEHFIILGPSGAGKTVLLEIIAGIIEPDEGRIILNGVDVTSYPPEKRNLAYIPQDYALFPHMTVYDNIAFGLKLRRISRQEIDRKVKEISKVLGIEHLLHRKPRTLSGGEKQRVAIARALVIEPELLLLDEPFANLDVQTKSRFMTEMKVWRKELGFTSLHVTHSFEEAISLGDRVGVMLRGRLVQVGDVKEVFSNPVDEGVARFLGFENIIEGVAKGNILEANGVKITLPISVEGKVRIGVRPEDIILSTEPVKTSARNEFRAEVIGIEELGPLVRVNLKIGGITLKAFITRSSLIELGISEGREVYVSFKTSAIKVF
ncbi:tungstate ABC transporter ATP-binding protein WtpC [Pyrococcus abyssi]|uniref:Molybdate/tungstate import ATP-binding protein WtpC n=1 Tax=Pyrococcus abyssi (strain GE5 / Orsay) TaxID=272844 RepID=WTPC_PYRAB|nr:tungstate ABC transporter ATP-binding protein WtpC [Pyrococcus abyssi]Q9V2C0.1 RecName: Full=Molybdate/tungstate import ATP-binding protein WtpC [Pyrococcus abyssi GE5]CAB49078.1 ABC transporter, ATP-binding protein, substrate unknown [Pyrococcus abyssi GE5]CCE69530.1 TPA: ABC transporter, ATP-binding protein [Pyrococcus abyssi GE5]